MAVAASTVDEKNGPPHLLQCDAQLDEAEPLSAVGFRDVDRGQPKLLAKLPPDLAVASLVGLHEAPDLGGRRLVLHEPAKNGAEFFLFFGETELHIAALLFGILARTGIGAKDRQAGGKAGRFDCWFSFVQVVI
jgi:hypothetical protein